MVEYKCIRCAKIYDKKFDYNRHIKRKFPCELILTTDFTEVIEINKMQQESENKLREHKCTYCSQTFTRQASLNVHLNERCKIKRSVGDDREKIFLNLIQELQEQNKKKDEEIKKKSESENDLKKDMATLKQQLSKVMSMVQGVNVTNNNIDKQQNVTIDKQQINNNNNIKLIAFGEEDLSYISDSVCKKLLNKGFKSVQYMLEHVHFNKNKPENHNIYIPNLKNDYVTIFNGGDWTLKKKDDILDTIIDNTNGYLAEKFDEFIKANSLDEATIRKYQRYLDEQDDAPVKKTIKEEIKLILYNNRKLPMGIRKMFETKEPKLLEE
jgi:DNA-directed RNA polymerase subunit RPC12/RpoP